MSNKRKRYRANKKKQKMLEKKNEFGMNDPTPYEAIKEIIKKDKKGRG